MMAGAFLFVLRWLVSSYGQDKARFIETVQNHINHNTQALAGQTSALEHLAQAVEHLAETRR